MTLITIGAVAAIILIGTYCVNPLFRFVSEGNKREMQTALTLAIVVGLSFLMNLGGLSPALGAFIAGLVLANSEYRDLIEGVIQPFKGLLLGLFFITIGAGVDFGFMFSDPLSLVGLALLLVLIKGAILFVIGTIYKLPTRDLWLFVLGLAQAGEFGFVLLAFSMQQGVIQRDLSQGLLAVIALTMLISPIFFGLFQKLTGRGAEQNKVGQYGKVKVFISYSRNNIEEMKSLKGFLENQGFEVNYDTRDIPYGEKWKREMRYLIEQADVVIWLISPSSVKSYWCNWELDEIEALKRKALFAHRIDVLYFV